jgi:hypothetical protein
MKLVRTLLMLSLGMLAMSQARSDSLRCETELVDVGDEVYDLLKKCGEPSAKEGDKWIYDQGPGELRMIVRVADGVVQSIQPESSEKP